MRLMGTMLVIAATSIPALAWAQPVPVGPEFQVNTQPINPQRHPAVAMDGSGNFVVVWQSYGSGILGQRFDSTGATVGGEFQVNTYTTLAQDHPTFVDGAARVSSRDTLLKATSSTPLAKKWRSACNKAVAADPLGPELFVCVPGVDKHVPKSDPLRKMYRQVVQTDVQP